MVSGRKRRQQGKQPVDEGRTCPKRDMDNVWVEEWPTDDIHSDEMNLNESEQERVFVNESLLEPIVTKQRLFWNP